MRSWLIVLLPTINPRAFLVSLKRPESFLPVAFFALALLGMLWADDSWPARLLGVHPVFKLLAIPLLLYHFSRSQRSSWVFIAFFASCVLLMACSWVIYFAPGLGSAKILTAGLLGDQYVGIEPGSDDKNLKNGDVIKQTQSAVVLENLIGQLIFNKAADAGSSGAPASTPGTALAPAPSASGGTSK